MGKRMFKRQRVLMAVINGLERKGILSRRAIVKSLFLLKKEYFLDNYISFYSFYPYKQGPFSQLCYSDLRNLNRDGLIDSKKTSLTENGVCFIDQSNAMFENQIHHLLERFNSGQEMTDYVYTKYPEFTVKSQLIDTKIVKKGRGYATIGYEQKNIDSFLNILIQNDIEVLIDVRINPFSMNFQFIGTKLKDYLKSVDIDYIHIPQLGIESNKRQNLKTKEDYIELFSDYEKGLEKKSKYLDKIILEGKKRKIALMCFEKDPSFCHRGVIAGYLRKNGHEVVDL